MKNDGEQPQKRNLGELVGERVRISLRGRIWWATFQVGQEQRRRSLKTTSKKEAIRKAFKIDCELAEGTYQTPGKSPSVEAVCMAYAAHLRTENKAKRTLAKVDLVIRRVRALAEVRRAKTIRDIDLPFVDAYRARRAAAGAKRKTLLNETVILRQIVNFALARDVITIDPLRNLKLKKEKGATQPCWTVHELDQIVASSTEPYRTAYTVLGDTGMRIGELVHLSWDDVDFDRGVLHIRPKGDWRPKTGDQRAVPMSPRVRALLESLPRRTPWVINSPPSKVYPQGDHQLSDRRALVHLKGVLKKLGLKGHVHTFRHSFISNAITQGIPEAIVRGWVGHVDAEILKLYTHIANTASKEAMQRLAAQTDQTRQEREAAARKEAAQNGE